MIRVKLIFISIILVLYGCKGDANQNNERDGIVCTASIEPGIVLEIRDAITDMPLAENALVVITDNDYSETLVVNGYDGADSSSAISVAGAYERSGTYDINVSLTDYTSWSRTGVVVTSGVCHVGTVKFTVRLEKVFPVNNNVIY
jgi:hypothetical protein